MTENIARTEAERVEAVERFGFDLPPETCHCGAPVAADAEPGAYAAPYMVDAFCGRCITVRCDAYPGACRSDSGYARPESSIAPEGVTEL